MTILEALVEEAVERRVLVNNHPPDQRSEVVTTIVGNRQSVEFDVVARCQVATELEGSALRTAGRQVFVDGNPHGYRSRSDSIAVVRDRTAGTRATVAFDVTPLQNLHRQRGIGRYVRGLAGVLMAQTEIPIEFWGWHDDRPFDVRPPHRGLWLRRFGMPRTRWGWMLGPLGMRIRNRLSAAVAVHLTDPRAFVPLHRPTFATVYDLIPLADEPRSGHDTERKRFDQYVRRLRRASELFAISRATAADLHARLRIPPPPVNIAVPGVAVPAAGVEPGQE